MPRRPLLSASCPASVRIAPTSIGRFSSTLNFMQSGPSSPLKKSYPVAIFL